MSNLMVRRPVRSFLLTAALALLVALCALVGRARPTHAQAPAWTLVWQDNFDGPANTGVNTNDWIYELGTGWGTGEVESMTNSTANVYLDGNGHLAIKPLRDANGKWTSGRIKTQRVDFAAPPGGLMAVEASIQQPNITGTAAAGYWPAFWMLGYPLHWPGTGEIDILEDINGLSSVFGTLHCGTYPGGPCNESTGIGSGKRSCNGCQTDYHTYRVEYDRSVSPEELRWYLDGVNYFTIQSTRVDATTWNNALHHGFFVIFDLAIGGGFPAAYGGGPTANTVPGVPMLVDYVRVYTAGSGPVISSLAPVQAQAGGDAFNLTINGSGFVSGSVANFGVVDLPTSFISSNQLSGLVSASSISSAGQVSVTVTNPGSLSSDPVSYTISAGCNPLLVSRATDDNQCGSFSYAVNAAKTGANKVVQFMPLNPGRISLHGSVNLPSGVTLQGICAASGPAITLDGTGVNGDGFLLQGSNLYGLRIQGFGGRQLVTGSGGNRLSCVRATG